MIRITFLGGVGSVTGSSYLIESPGGEKVLVDCGLFQGGEQAEKRNWEEWGFAPKAIKTLFLTHAHIDHSGRIPKLVKEGFQSRIITSSPTYDLCRIMLLDSATVQEMDAQWQTRKNKRQAKEAVVPLYTTEDAEASFKFFSPVERDKIIAIAPNIKARLRNAGHILGSSILELWMGENNDSLKMVFSGDLGKKNQLIVKDPYEIIAADYLFVESTYGDRLHRSFEESKAELLEAIRYSISHREKVLIPAFAVERTQEILYVLGEFHRKGLLPDIPVYLDSTLAIKATEIFKKYKECYDQETQAIVDQGYDPFDLPALHFTESTRESMAINETTGPAIIIAGNGMCTGGRIVHHLKHNLWREGASLVIVGFQAEGTTGRRIVEGAKEIRLFRENVAVRAKVFTIGGFSAHADQKDLLQWVGRFESKPRVFVVHGEAKASEALATKIRELFNLEVHIPTWKDHLVLEARKVAYEGPPKEAAQPDFATMMLNNMRDLETELIALRNRIKSRAKERKIGEDDLHRLNYVQEELRALLSE